MVMGSGLGWVGEDGEGMKNMMIVDGFNCFDFQIFLSRLDTLLPQPRCPFPSPKTGLKVLCDVFVCSRGCARRVPVCTMFVCVGR